MSEELKTLLSLFISPETSQEQRETARQALLQFYSNPQSTLELLTLYPNEQNRQIRFAAAVGLTRSLKLNWDNNLYSSDFHEPIKQAIIQILQFETDSIIRHTLVRAIIPVMKRDSDRWPELLQLITTLTSNRSDHLSVEFAMYLITFFVEHLPPSQRTENLPFFVQLCEFSFSSSNPALIDTAFGLVAQLIRLYEDEEAAFLQPIFTQMLDIYLVSLTQDDSFRKKIANKLDFAFVRDNYPLPMEYIFSKLFEGIPSDPIVAFIPIQKLVQGYGNLILPIFPEIIQQTLVAANQVFTDDTLEANSDSTFILETLGFIESSVKPRIFFPKLLEMISTQSVQDTVVSAIAIAQIADQSKEFVMKNIGHLSEFVINLLQFENISAKDAALELIKEIASSFSEGQKNTRANEFVTPIFQLLGSGHPVIVKHSLAALSQLFDCCDIDVNLIKPSIEALIQLLNMGLDNVFNSLIVDALSSLIFSAGEDIAPYVEALLPIVVQMASISENDDPTTKANALSALSNLLRFSSLPDELINQSIGLIVTSGNTKDYDIRKTVMQSLSNILTCHFPNLLNFAQPIQEIITAYMSEDLEDNQENEEVNFDDEEDEDEEFAGNQNQIDSLTNMLLLVKNIYKLYPELGPEAPMTWFNYSVAHMETFNDDFSVAAFLACLYMLLKIPQAIDPSEFFRMVFEKFDDSGNTVVANCFKVISRCIDNDYQLPQEMIQNAIDKAKLFLVHKLECQADSLGSVDDSSLTLSMQANRFLSVIATKIPAAFPLNEYIDYGSKLNKSEGEEFELSQYIGVLRQLYFNEQMKLSPLQSKMIVKNFLQNLPICDFTVIPEPLIAIKILLEKQDPKIASQLPEILKFIDELFQNDNHGEMHYWTTLTNAASFICTMIRMNISSVDLQVWIPRILNVLPIQGDEMEAEHIYSTILWLISQPEIGTQIISSLGANLIKICAQTLGLHEKVLSSYHLTEATYHGIISLLMTLLSSNQEAAAIMDQSFSDELAKGRCHAILEQVSK